MAGQCKHLVSGRRRISLKPVMAAASRSNIRQIQRHPSSWVPHNAETNLPFASLLLLCLCMPFWPTTSRPSCGQLLTSFPGASAYRGHILPAQMLVFWLTAIRKVHLSKQRPPLVGWTTSCGWLVSNSAIRELHLVRPVSAPVRSHCALPFAFSRLLFWLHRSRPDVGWRQRSRC